MMKFIKTNILIPINFILIKYVSWINLVKIVLFLSLYIKLFIYEHNAIIYKNEKWQTWISILRK